MSMRPASAPSLWHYVGGGGHLTGRRIQGRAETVALGDLATRSSLGPALADLRGRSVLVASKGQLATALAMIELDGVARRIVLCPPEALDKHLSAILRTAAIDVAFTDEAISGTLAGELERVVVCQPGLNHAAAARPAVTETEWVLLTSGTTGVPKLVGHTLATLLGPIDNRAVPPVPPIWSTFYDIRRYGGLQIILRALTGGGSMVLSDAEETPDGFLDRIAASGVTHISGTPSHWRRAAMGKLGNIVAPEYIRLSGEIADQAILDQLHALCPASKIVHAFASTEAGVGFEVADQRAGFPAELINRPKPGVDIEVREGTLRIRSDRTAFHYLGDGAPDLRDAAGFVNTGDMVEMRDDRYYFVGRRDGMINVGGLKVHPEEVEAVINRHPHVRMSRVKARTNPITGAVVAAEIVPRDAADVAPGSSSAAVLREEILRICRDTMPAYKVPAIVRFVSSLEMTPAGKVARDKA